MRRSPLGRATAVGRGGFGGERVARPVVDVFAVSCISSKMSVGEVLSCSPLIVVVSGARLGLTTGVEGTLGLLRRLFELSARISLPVALRVLNVPGAGSLLSVRVRKACRMLMGNDYHTCRHESPPICGGCGCVACSLRRRRARLVVPRNPKESGEKRRYARGASDGRDISTKPGRRPETTCGKRVSSCVWHPELHVAVRRLRLHRTVIMEIGYTNCVQGQRSSVQFA